MFCKADISKLQCIRNYEVTGIHIHTHAHTLSRSPRTIGAGGFHNNLSNFAAELNSSKDPMKGT